jgi:hypothetical protein
MGIASQAGAAWHVSIPLSFVLSLVHRSQHVWFAPHAYMLASLCTWLAVEHFTSALQAIAKCRTWSASAGPYLGSDC